jgi:hypothetical protein
MKIDTTNRQVKTSSDLESAAKNAAVSSHSVLTIYMPKGIVTGRRDLERSISATLRAIERNPVSCHSLGLGHFVTGGDEATGTQYLCAASDQVSDETVQVTWSDEFAADLSINTHASYKSKPYSIEVKLPSQHYWKRRACEIPQPQWLKLLLEYTSDSQDLLNLSKLFQGKICIGALEGSVYTKSLYDFWDTHYEDKAGLLPIDHIKRQLLADYVLGKDVYVGLQEYALVANFKALLPSLSEKLSAYS